MIWLAVGVGVGSSDPGRTVYLTVLQADKYPELQRMMRILIDTGSTSDHRLVLSVHVQRTTDVYCVNVF